MNFTDINIAKILTEYFTSTSGITLILNATIGFYWTQKAKRMQQKAQNTLDKEIAKYKHQLQVKFIKAEVKTKQLFSIYPELFLRFKDAESIICFICSKKENKDLIAPTELSDATSKIHLAVSFMVKNLLFVSKEVEKGSDDLMEWMHQFEKIIAEDSENNIQSYKQRVRQLTDNLQSQMQKELGSEIKES